MSAKNSTTPRANWGLLVITWIVALLILLTLAYKLLFQKQVERTGSCLDQASSTQAATSPLAVVEKYAACIAWTADRAAAASATPLRARCRYAGVWAATRGNMVYQVTLEVDGKFLAEPGENVPAHEQAVTGAWTVAGNSMVWAYDSGAAWPPDINPISAQTEDAFTLTEVNRATTRYTLIERTKPEACLKQ